MNEITICKQYYTSTKPATGKIKQFQENNSCVSNNMPCMCYSHDNKHLSKQ